MRASPRSAPRRGRSNEHSRLAYRPDRRGGLWGIALPDWLTPEGHPDKSPRAPSGKRLDVTNATGWGTHAEAAEAVAEHVAGGERALLARRLDPAASPLVCLDLDPVPDDGVADLNLRFGLECLAFCGWRETSQSGRGIHAWFFGRLPAEARSAIPNAKADVFAHRRHIIVTGIAPAGGHGEPCVVPDALLSMLERRSAPQRGQGVGVQGIVPLPLIEEGFRLLPPVPPGRGGYDAWCNALRAGQAGAGDAAMDAACAWSAEGGGSAEAAARKWDEVGIDAIPAHAMANLLRQAAKLYDGLPLAKRRPWERAVLVSRAKAQRCREVAGQIEQAVRGALGQAVARTCLPPSVRMGALPSPAWKSRRAWARSPGRA